MPSVFIFLTDGDVILRASPLYLGILRQMYTESNINKWKKQNPHSVSFPSNFIHFVHISILKNQLTISIIEKFLKLSNEITRKITKSTKLYKYIIYIST